MEAGYNLVGNHDESRPQTHALFQCPPIVLQGSKAVSSLQVF
jgi:hypothetical protein